MATSWQRQRTPNIGSLVDLNNPAPGYYLVKGDARYFIGAIISEPSLNRVAERVLSDRTGWNYWVDYCMGRDVTGRAAWANVDKTDLFI